MYDILKCCASIIYLENVKISFKYAYYFFCNRRCTRFSGTTLEKAANFEDAASAVASVGT